MEDAYEFDAPADRRRHPRAEALSHVRVQILSAPVDAQLQEISAGGCAVETTDIPGKGAHRLRLACDGMPPLDVSAELVHVTRVALPGAEPFYLAGFEFLSPNRATVDALERVVARVSALCPA